MRVHPIVLIILTALVSLAMSLQLLSSWTEPQTQSQLNLYQSDLVLEASVWDELNQQIKENPSLRTSLLGDNPTQDALKNYQSVRDSALKDIEKTKPNQNQQSNTPTNAPSSSGPTSFPSDHPLEASIDVDPESTPVPRSRAEARGQLIDEIDLRLGLLYTQTKSSAKALDVWTQLANNPQAQDSLKQRVPAAQVLLGLWSTPPRILPNAEQTLNRHLKGWFRYQGLTQLYQLQQRQDALLALGDTEQKTAQNALVRLTLVGVMPVLGSVIGVIILLTWGLRTWWAKQSTPDKVRDPLSSAIELRPGDIDQKGVVSWTTETIWQVMVLWFTAFFGMSFLVVPLTVKLLGLKPETFDGRMQAYLALFSYGGLMIVGFSILQISLRPFVPSFWKWLQLRFSGNWSLWGLGGYFVALPLVLIVSLLNQKLLREQGGGNPILDVILQGHDGFTIAILWFLVAICAPLFEETLFRGFFLTSLTRYLPVWQAIAFSGVMFALAHLNLADLLPLSLLGMVLGFVYWRSRNLLASMWLHSLWNSGSLIGLLILSGSNS